jgi:hypothetical protein
MELKKWIGPLVTIAILFIGTMASKLPYNLEVLVRHPIFRISIIIIVLISNFVNSYIAILLAISLVISLRFLGKYLDKSKNIDHNKMSEDEFKQYMFEVGTLQ